MDMRWDPHVCAGCGGRFEVGYEEPPEDASAILVEIACPGCGKAKSLSLPESAMGRVQVESIEDGEAHDEGGGD